VVVGKSKQEKRRQIRFAPKFFTLMSSHRTCPEKPAPMCTCLGSPVQDNCTGSGFENDPRIEILAKKHEDDEVSWF